MKPGNMIVVVGNACVRESAEGYFDVEMRGYKKTVPEDEARDLLYALRMMFGDKL